MVAGPVVIPAGPGGGRSDPGSIPGMDQSLRYSGETILSAQTYNDKVYEWYFLLLKVLSRRITVIAGNTDASVINVLCCVSANILHCNNDREAELLLSIG